MATANKKYYAWTGQNATMGKPHPITGNYSMYGEAFVFKTKAERDAYVEDFRSDNPGEYTISCDYRKLRGHCLGMTMRVFDEYLQERECGYSLD